MHDPSLCPPFASSLFPQGNLEVVWLLLQHGFSVSDIDDCGNTCLHLATASGHNDVVKSLLCAGTDLTTANWYGNTALALATNGTTRALLQKLMDQKKCAATPHCEDHMH